MADALLSASLQVLFDRVASPDLINFIRAQKLSHELLTNLKRKLLVVHKVLNDAEVKQFSDPLVKDWLIQVKDAMYHAEDLLDEIATDALRSKIEAADSRTSGTHQVWNQLSAWVKAPFATQNMESRVKEMIAKLEAIADEKDKLGLKEGEGEKLSARSPSTSLVDESSVYGRNEIKEEMVKWLLSDKENATGNNIDVMSIVGMGGSGKTTLAQLLYNHDGVKEHFHLKAWVCVSTELLLLRVTKSILEEIGSRPACDGNLNLLQLQLKESLGNKKFLLILDDVWEMKSLDWDSLRTPLLASAQGSKIIVTSRSETVAKTMRAVYTRRLGELSPEDCWSLFTKLAFPDGDSCAYPELEPIGRRIVEKCRGLPLAVKSLGSLLHSRAETKEWEEILRSKIWDLPTDFEILPSLMLSYHHLSLPLKRCFAYCSIFPKDHEFDKGKLILLWMAEGLLQLPQCNKRMEEVGDLYFNELVARSFFQKSVRDDDRFVMHDLIHDLAQHVSGEFCVQFEDAKVQTISEKARHFLYFQSGFNRFVVFETFEAITKATYLRSFLEVKEQCLEYMLSNRVLQDIIPRMRFLRALSLCDYNIIDLPDTIGNLKHLRYLDLSGTWIEKLPESICCLCNLQTMILKSCLSLLELPLEMGKLINLRYLDISWSYLLKEMPIDIHQLKSLQELPHFIVGQKSGFNIGGLRALREIRGTLRILKMENVVGVEDALQANMKDKKYLDGLFLEWSEVIESGAADDILNRLTPHPNLKRLSIEGYPGLTFPNWLGDGSFSNLVSLWLSNCGNCSALPPLGQLPCLRSLEISDMKGVVRVGSEFYGNASSSFQPSFPSLQTLSFRHMENWEKWLWCGGRRGEFPRLQKFSIISCPKLTGKLPKNLRSLKGLEIHLSSHLLPAPLKVPAIRELWMSGFGKLQLKRPACGFTSLQTCEIEISDASQWKQLPVAPQQRLSITKCDFVESLLEEEISQANISNLGINYCCFSRSLHKISLPTTLKWLSIYKCTELEFLLPELLRCHHPVLEALRIQGGTCDTLSLSFSFGIFPRLASFEIDDLEGLDFLSISNSDGNSPFLHRLRIGRCPNLVYIELSVLNSESCWISDCSKLRLLALTHSSLRELRLQNCPEVLFQREGLPSNLHELEIQNCNQLTFQVARGLERLASLTRLSIKGGCEDVDLFPKECLLPSSLTSLQIAKFSNLKSLGSRESQRLTSLLQLEISNCPELHCFAGSVLQHLISLKVLRICDCPRLQSLREVGFQQLTSLVELEISQCCELQSLTKVGLQYLTSLETLTIQRCSKLQYLTKQRLPDSISYLYIDECPLLEQRCKFEKGLEWCYIAHIPKIVINYELY